MQQVTFIVCLAVALFVAGVFATQFRAQTVGASDRWSNLPVARSAIMLWGVLAGTALFIAFNAGLKLAGVP